MMRTLILAVVVVLPISAVLPFSASAECTLITGARVLLPGGVAERTVQITDGVISSVSEEQLLATTCQVVDARGAMVTPGLIETVSQVGLMEVERVAAARDDSGGDGAIRATFSAADAYNPRSSLIPITRRGGITTALLVPSDGWIHGRSSAVDLAGQTQAETIVARDLAMYTRIASPGNNSRAHVLHQLRLALLEAREFPRHRAAWESGRFRRLHVGPLELEALQPVVTGQMPLVVSVDRASDIEALLRLEKELSLKLILRGGAEAWLVADQLADRKIPVIIDPLVAGPRSFDMLQARPDNAALLHAAGVPVIISSMWTHNARTLTQVAGNAVRSGLPWEAALHAITSVPARVFGIPERGEIAVGKRANLVVWSGDPLELSSYPTHVFIGGVAQSLETRQTRLRDRYLTDPSSPVTDPPLP